MRITQVTQINFMIKRGTFAVVKHRMKLYTINVSRLRILYLLHFRFEPKIFDILTQTNVYTRDNNFLMYLLLRRNKFIKTCFWREMQSVTVTINNKQIDMLFSGSNSVIPRNSLLTCGSGPTTRNYRIRVSIEFLLQEFLEFGSR